MATSDQIDSTESGSGSDNAKSAYNYFVGQGYSPVQASGIVGNLQGESGQSLNPAAVSAGDGGDGSDSIGIAQWNGARAQALKDYAASKGVPWTDLPTQLEFAHSELQGPEGGAYKRLVAAQTPDDAAQAMLAYERPKDWDKPGAHPERARYARAAFAAYGGGLQDSQPAPASPSAVPQAAPPIFASQQQAPAAGADAAPMPAPQAFAAPNAPPPIFAPQPRQIDLSKLRAALAARAPIFSNPQG